MDSSMQIFTLTLVSMSLGFLAMILRQIFKARITILGGPLSDLNKVTVINANHCL